MTFVIASLIACGVVELLFRLPVIEKSADIVRTSKKSWKVLSSKRISDHWKELVLLSYSKTIFLSAIVILGYFGGIVLLVWACVYSAQVFLSLDIVSYLEGWEGILVVSILSTAYLVVRWHFD